MTEDDKALLGKMLLSVMEMQAHVLATVRLMQGILLNEKPADCVSDIAARHYAAMPDGDSAENTRWTQSAYARTLRAVAVADMPDVLDQWSGVASSFQKRDARDDALDGLRREVVRRLKERGLLSAKTYYRDVDVERIMSEARALAMARR